MSSTRPTIARCVLGFLIVALAPSASPAGGFGLHHPHHGYVMRSSSVGTGVVGVGTSGVLMPSALVAPTVATQGALMPMGLSPAGLTTQNALMPSGLMVYTVGATGSSNAAPILGGGAAKAPSPLLPSALAPAGATVGSDFRARYNNYVLTDNYPFGSSLVPSDVAQLGSNHAGLSNALGGMHRLGSIGRFLKGELSDPNFRAKAFDLFGMFLGTALPQFAPAIDLFLGQLGQGGDKPATPLPGEATSPPDPGGVGGRFEGQLNQNGGFTGRFIPDPAPAPAPGQTPATPPVPAPGGQVDPLLGATVISSDATGMTLKRTDGKTVKFGPTGIPNPNP